MKDERLNAHKYLTKKDIVELCSLKGTNLYGLYNFDD